MIVKLNALIGIWTPTHALVCAKFIMTLTFLGLPLKNCGWLAHQLIKLATWVNLQVVTTNQLSLFLQICLRGLLWLIDG